MNRPAIWSPTASAEFDGYRNSFDAKDDGLGDYFSSEIHAAVDRIESNPLAFSIFNRKGSRLAMTDKFKFGVMFRIVDDDVYIVSIVALESHPAKWMNRG